MRMRSLTIDAESFEEFMKLSNEDDAILEVRKSQLNPAWINNDDNEEDSDEQLSSNNTYILKKRLEVIEEEEEIELHEQLSQMNIAYHQKNHNKSINDDLSDIDQDEDRSTFNSSFILQQEDPLFYSQNISVASQTLKYLVIGDKRSGKSTLIDCFLGNKVDYSQYDPTVSLEIKKALYINNQSNKVRLEFWDTNKHVIESKMIQTYMKIATGFIFICDIADRSSLNFLKEQLENVHRYSSMKNNSNLFIYLNISSTSREVTADVIKENMDFFYSISDHYHMESKRINPQDLSNYSPENDMLFKTFVSNCIR